MKNDSVFYFTTRNICLKRLNENDLRRLSTGVLSLFRALA